MTWHQISPFQHYDHCGLIVVNWSANWTDNWIAIAWDGR